jgi:histidinol-phosphate aminotransferase
MLLPKQSWWYYKSVASEVYGKPVEYPLHARHAQFVYDPDEIAELYDVHKPQIILIASPNNPTGNSIGSDALTALIDHCSSSVIILDEAYAGFSGESTSHLPHLLGSHERLIVLRTFSKYYALAGLRIGYACVANGLTHLIAYSARYLGYNQLSEQIAMAALDDEPYYRMISQRMRQDKLLYYKEFHSMKGFTPFLSDANFILVRYPESCKSVLQRELEKKKIVLKFFEDRVLDNHMRVTIGTEEQNAYVLSSLATIAEHHIRSVPLLAKK